MAETANQNISDEDPSYDPYEHRFVKSSTTNIQALVHIVKATCGTGILAMPEAFHHAGLLGGLVGTVLFTAFSTYCLHILIRSKYMLCKKLKIPSITYRDSFNTALKIGPCSLQKMSRYLAYAIDIFMIIHQLGGCCVYTLFIALTVKVVCDHYVPHSIVLEIYLIFLFAPIVLINTIRNLKVLAPYNIAANIVTFCALGGILYYTFFDLPPITERRMVPSLEKFPLFFGTTLFAVECIGVVVAVEDSMEDPRRFGGVCGILNLSMFITVIIYTLVAFMGYWKYGEETKSSITLNLPSNKPFAQVVRILYCLALYVSYAIHSFVAIDIAWNIYTVDHLKASPHLIAWEQLMRIASVVFAFFLSAMVPLLGLFISLLGAFCVSSLGIIFPAIMELCVRWKHDLGTCRWVLVKDLLFVLIGLLGLIAGCYVSLREICRDLKLIYS